MSDKKKLFDTLTHHSVQTLNPELPLYDRIGHFNNLTLTTLQAAYTDKALMPKILPAFSEIVWRKTFDSFQREVSHTMDTRSRLYVQHRFYQTVDSVQTGVRARRPSSSEGEFGLSLDDIVANPVDARAKRMMNTITKQLGKRTPIYAMTL